MPTLKKRINITLSDDLIRALSALAKKEDVPVATKAKTLLEEIIEIHEDDVWNKLLKKRSMQTQKYLSHDKAWK